MSNYHQKQENEKQAKLDQEWIAERLAALIAELKIVKEPNRQAFIRGTMKAAMRAHEQLGAGLQVSLNSDEFE